MENLNIFGLRKKMIEDNEIYQKIKEREINPPESSIDWIPLKKILWALKNAKDNSSVAALTPKSISYLIYKFFEEKISEKSIYNAIARSKKFVMKKEGKFYEITKQGRKKLEEDNSNKGIVYVGGDKPWTDRNSKFSEFIDKLKGEILIIDPYYGVGTLHILSKFPKDIKLKFLTSKMGDGENSIALSKEISRFKKEFKNSELKSYQKFYELHDRYIISDNYLVIVGNGIKDVGDKEGFLIAIPSEEVSEIINNLKQKFKLRWRKSNNLT